MLTAMTAAGTPLGRRDVAITVVISAIGVLLMIENVTGSDVDASALTIPFFLLVTVPVLWRRAMPLAAAGAVLGAVAVHVALFGTITRCGVAFPVGFLLAYGAASQLEAREALMSLGLVFAMFVVMLSADFSAGFDALTIFGPLTLGTWALGRLMRRRSAMVAELRERNTELRDVRDSRARLEVATDRARLSAELDELLRRRLAALARLAGEGAEGDPATVSARLEDIERESRRTLEEMRAVVGALRHDDLGAATTSPQPTLTHLDALVVRAAGAHGRLTVEGSPRVLPAGVELSAYRIVEHLLDALDETDDVDVRVRFGDDALDLAVSGAARRRSDAAGALERARERAALHRGTLEASTHGGRAEVVAHLPVLAAV